MSKKITEPAHDIGLKNGHNELAINQELIDFIRSVRFHLNRTIVHFNPSNDPKLHAQGKATGEGRGTPSKGSKSKGKRSPMPRSASRKRR